MGAIVDQVQLDNVMRYIGLGQSEGAKLLAGGERVAPVAGGCYVQPTIFDGVTNSMTIAREEIFGPVLSVLSFTDAADVVKQANNNIYGLQAAVWTRDINKAHGVARALRAGTVHVNSVRRGRHHRALRRLQAERSGARQVAARVRQVHRMQRPTWIRIDSPILKETDMNAPQK